MKLNFANVKKYDRALYNNLCQLQMVIEVLGHVIINLQNCQTTKNGAFHGCITLPELWAIYKYKFFDAGSRNEVAGYNG